MTNISQTGDKIIEEVETASAKINKIKAAASSKIYGQDSVIDLTLVTILSGGHALLIGVPGLAKTLLVETLGTVLGLSNKRVQFTPDLMPSDILGAEVLEQAETGERSFRFIKGPIFTQLLMADEINRASEAARRHYQPRTLKGSSALSLQGTRVPSSAVYRRVNEQRRNPRNAAGATQAKPRHVEKNGPP